jgi:hypothetical protein
MSTETRTQSSVSTAEDKNNFNLYSHTYGAILQNYKKMKGKHKTGRKVSISQDTKSKTEAYAILPQKWGNVVAEGR